MLNFTIIAVAGIVLGIALAPLSKEVIKNHFLGITLGFVVGAVLLITAYALEEAVDKRADLLFIGLFTYAASLSLSIYIRWKREKASPGKK